MTFLCSLRLLPAPAPALLPVLLPVLLAGCAVGPNYAGPPPPPVAPGAAFARGGDVAPATGATGAAPVAGQWWLVLGDPVLNDLIARAFASNPTLDIATARLRQARASLRQDRAAGLPTLNGSLLGAKAELPPTGDGKSGTDITLFNAGFDSSWELDLFGGRARAIEAARASVEAGEASLADRQVSLSAEVAQAYVRLRARQQALALATEALALQEQGVALTRQRYDQGVIGQPDLARARQSLETARARVAPMKAELDAYRDEIATLTGAAPGALDVLLGTGGAIPLPPAAVPIGDPATLLRQRPDIRAAERRLAARTAKVGQAEAARLPHISFLGLFGLGGSSLSDLADVDTRFFAVAPQLRWNLLDYGAGAARVRGAAAQRDEAEADYRATVLDALRDAEDALSRFAHSREALASLVRAERQDAEALALTRQREAAGTASLAELLVARQRTVEARQAVADGTASLAAAFVAVEKALGLGWGSAGPPLSAAP